MNQTFKIDSSAILKHASTLMQLSRSALPVAVRQTLNSVTFDMKQDTILKSAKNAFVEREPNFFKVVTTVVQAQGFDINSMQSMVAFDTTKSKKPAGKFAVEELEQQEHGGTIGHRGFIPMDNARVGRNSGKSVRRANKLGNISKIVKTNEVKGVNEQQRFIKSAVHAGVGGHVLAEYKGRQILWRVNSLNRSKYKMFRLSALYTFNRGRKVKVASTHFMQTASLESATKLNMFFDRHARRQVDKFLKRK